MAPNRQRGALEFVLQAFPPDDIEVHLAYIFQKPSGVPDPIPDEVTASHMHASQGILSNGERLVRKRLGNPVTHLESGSPGERLLGLADELKPDLVVLGTVRHSASERLIGTVSSRFLGSRRHALLIVP